MQPDLWDGADLPWARWQRPGAVDRALQRRGERGWFGVDEVGRGPLAGPVVACAVWMQSRRVRRWQAFGVTDSKALDAERRAWILDRLQADGLTFALGVCSVEEIEQLNIRGASLEAMRRAVRSLQEALGGAAEAGPGPWLLVDGKTVVPGVSGCRQTPLVGGDLRSLAVGAASIVAKQWRDGWMAEAGTRWPAYGFERHAGYGTPAHLAALAQHGPCPIHRRGFAPVRRALAAAASGASESVHGETPFFD
jgi:ribonuclease HII